MRTWQVVRYVCGQCGLDTRCTVPETTDHWAKCVQKASKESP